MARRNSFFFSAVLVAVIAFVAILFTASAHASKVDERYGAIVMDGASGEVLHAQNADETLYPASLTKVMTLYLTFDALEKGTLKLDTRLPVSANAVKQPPSKLGVRRGETIRVEDAIMALVTKSANDVAVVLAEALAGSEAAFTAKMTHKARALGMKSTTYRTASGLPDPDQVSTPRDQAVLARALIRNHSKYYHYFSTVQFRYKGKPVTTHNRVVQRYDGADGIKTGYIKASGFNLMASARREGKRVIVVVFGGPSSTWRDAHVEDLMDMGFSKMGVEPVQTALRVSAPKGSNVAVARTKPESIDSLIVAAREQKSPSKGRVVVAANHPSSKPWTIQVGAYGNRKAAQNAAGQALKSVGGNAEVQIDTVKKGRKQLYRAKVTGLTEDQAHRACKTLARGKGNSCQIIQPKA